MSPRHHVRHCIKDRHPCLVPATVADLYRPGDVAEAYPDLDDKGLETALQVFEGLNFTMLWTLVNCEL